MHIAIFSLETAHSGAVSGVAFHVTQLALALHRLGHDIHVFTRNGPPSEDVPREQVIGGVHYHLIAPLLVTQHPQPTPSPSVSSQLAHAQAKAWLSSMEAMEASGIRFDVFHGHDWSAVPCLLQLVQQHRRTVWTLHLTEKGRGGVDDEKRVLEQKGADAVGRLIVVAPPFADECRSCLSMGTAPPAHSSKRFGWSPVPLIWHATTRVA
mmetsp:Transcript_36392/g.58854  ORF Transcript_36392/g.58854 Transcript_36392/m.58854 type:complete len:209 (+) Transcript_36392:1332-1958(+)